MIHARTRLNLESLDDRIVPAMVLPDPSEVLPLTNPDSIGNNAYVAPSWSSSDSYPNYGSGSGGAPSASGFLSANDSYPNSAYGSSSYSYPNNAYGNGSGSGSGGEVSAPGFLSANDSYPNDAYGSGSGSNSANASVTGTAGVASFDFGGSGNNSYTPGGSGSGSGSGFLSDPGTGNNSYSLGSGSGSGSSSPGDAYVDSAAPAGDGPAFDVGLFAGSGPSNLDLVTPGVPNSGVNPGVWFGGESTDASVDLRNGPGANDIMVGSGITLMASEPPPHHGAVGSYLKTHAENMAREEDMRRQQAIQDRNGHIRTVINANQNWTQAEKDKITARVVELAEASHFQWGHSTGTFGDCDKWVNEYLNCTGKLQSQIIADGLRGYIDVGPAGWHNKYFEWLGAGHAAVRIALSDGTEFFLDDGNIGGSDHMFTADEVPGKYILYHVAPLFPKKP